LKPILLEIEELRIFPTTETDRRDRKENVEFTEIEGRSRYYQRHFFRNSQ